jgi:aminocarboxymuconate-semialdehyde decarboxylase
MQNPYAYLGSVYADSLTHSEKALRFLVDVLGEDHIVLGSDYPFDMGVPDPHGAMTDAIDDEGVRAKIGGDTAARLLGITASAEGGTGSGDRAESGN